MSRSPIQCCNGCVPPKRTPTCHATCPEYAKEKAKHELERELQYKQRDVDSNIYAQRSRSVQRARRARRI